MNSVLSTYSVLQYYSRDLNRVFLGGKSGNLGNYYYYLAHNGGFSQQSMAICITIAMALYTSGNVAAVY